MSTERRKRQRRSAVLKALISWEQPGQRMCQERATVRNISETGVLLETQHQLPTRAYVEVAIESAHIRGMASVRYSDPEGLHYLTGLEFSGGMTYREPSDAVGPDRMG